MAPSLQSVAQNELSKRFVSYCDLDSVGCRNWYSWGRWVFAAVFVILVIALFAVWGCISSRNRRRRGVQPLYGTGWLSAPPKYPGPPGQGPGTYPPPPPAYTAPPQQPAHTGTSFSTSQGYYGHHNDIQMTPQPPPNTYQTPAYFAPPPGPPPAK